MCRDFLAEIFHSTTPHNLYPVFQELDFQTDNERRTTLSITFQMVFFFVEPS